MQAFKLDSFFPALIGLLAAAVALYSRSKKNREEAAKRPRPFAEGFPVFMDWPEPDEEAAERAAVRPRREAELPQEGLRVTAQGPGQGTVQGAAVHARKTLANTTTTALVGEEKHPLLEDFSVARAVVYEALLQPKFKEL